MKKIFLVVALIAFVCGPAMVSYAQDGEKKAKTQKTTKTTKTKKATKKSSTCKSKKTCCKKKGNYK